MSDADRIALASATARDKLGAVERAAIARLLETYQDAERRLVAELERFADASGNLRLEVTSDYLAQVRAVIDILRRAQRENLADGLLSAADLGAGVFTSGPTLTVVAEAATRFVEGFVAADGLKLSDRLWRLENGALRAIADVLRTSIVLGRDASASAADFLARGEAVPLDVLRNMNAANVGSLADDVRSIMTRGPGNAYANALRVFRTELNRAHGQAYQAGAGANPDVIGMKFNLSPNHPRVDICDAHARANLYGLGPGVYPVGQAPWPAHPNTMSYLTAVFRDEVSAADRAGRQDRIAYLRDLPDDVQDRILGAAKAKALRAGVLHENDIETPWKKLKDGYERSGYQFET